MLKNILNIKVILEIYNFLQELSIWKLTMETGRIRPIGILIRLPKKKDFGDGPFIPCEIIRLPKAVVFITDNDSNFQEQDIEEKVQSDKPKDTLNQNAESGNKTHKKPEKQIPPKVKVPKKINNMFVRGLKLVGRFIVEHPVESLEIAGVVIRGAAKAISSVAEKVVDIVEKASRSLPNENDVSSHKQRYHTKNGVIWKYKAPYHRDSK